MQLQISWVLHHPAPHLQPHLLGSTCPVSPQRPGADRLWLLLTLLTVLGASQIPRALPPSSCGGRGGGALPRTLPGILPGEAEAPAEGEVPGQHSRVPPPSGDAPLPRIPLGVEPLEHFPVDCPFLSCLDPLGSSPQACFCQIPPEKECLPGQDVPSTGAGGVSLVQGCSPPAPEMRPACQGPCRTHLLNRAFRH